MKYISKAVSAVFLDRGGNKIDHLVTIQGQRSLTEATDT